jgi:hypothetical protein
VAGDSLKIRSIDCNTQPRARPDRSRIWRLESPNRLGNRLVNERVTIGGVALLRMLQKLSELRLRGEGQRGARARLRGFVSLPAEIA